MEETTRPELRNLMGSDRVSDVRSEKPGKSLRQSSPSWLRRVGFSISLLIIPVAYTLLLAMMGYLHGKKQSSFGDTVLEILSVASTLWPILFAAVLGPLLKSIALFRAERGSTLGSLEFLLTSQTTASALKNAMTMGWIGSWAILVLIVWSLSPLGGQAALRSLHRQQSPISTKTPAAYFLGNNESEIQTYYYGGASVFQGESGRLSRISDMRTVLAVPFLKQDTLVSHANSSSPHYNETITGLGGKREASRSGRRDLWRNVRIPFIELLPGYRSDDPHAWIPVSDDEIVPYASLIGLPIRNVSTVVLIICAVANVVIRQLIKAPDFLDNITGLTRDSPFIDLPQDGSGKSGPDGLATVKNVKVRIGDIYPERETGRIALTTELNSPKLRWNRSYS
ncbi:hypothetical protein ACHAP4_008723 [Fusarium culmorum]